MEWGLATVSTDPAQVTGGQPVMTKFRDVYRALVAMSKNGQCEVQQPELAELAGVSVRHLRRLVRELHEIGVIEVQPLRDRRGYKTKSRYILKSLEDTGSPLGFSPRGHWESSRDGLKDSWSPLGPPRGLQESEHVNMHDDDAINFKILNLLDFFTEPGRSYCASKCTLEQAKAWRSLKDYYDTHELWEAVGVTKNPIGWIYRMIELGHPPPAIQIPLPGAAADMSGFSSRGMTKEEIEADHPMRQAGATLGEDGKWR